MMKHMYRYCILMGSFLMLSPLAIADETELTGHAKEGKIIFDRVCLYCHTTDEDSKFGPSLKWIGERRDVAWLDAWLKNPEAMIEHDEYAKILVESNEYGLTMPSLPDMQDAQKRADVIAYLLAEFQ